MTELMADVPQEGQIDLKPEEENDDSQSSPDTTNEGEDTTDDDTDDTDTGTDTDTDTDPDKDTPFHEHPRWLKREEEWEERFNTQETRHQDDIKKIREDFKEDRKANADQTDIPSWFGGDQEQWNAYRTDRDKEIQDAEDRVVEKFTKSKADETKAVDDATAYMNSELKAIENDKTLNPESKKIDPNELLKVVMDNDLIDSKGRWNYKAAWVIMRGTVKTQTKNKSDRKKIAGATTSEPTGETKPKTFKTNKDFEQVRPW